MTVAMRRLATTAADFEAQFQRVLHWSEATDAAIEQRVDEILADVQARGDAAVLAYTQRFDHLDAASMAELELTRADLQAALEVITRAGRDAWSASEGESSRLARVAEAIARQVDETHGRLEHVVRAELARGRAMT